MNKRVVLICFYDRICLSLRLLSSVLKRDGHQVHLIYFKDDRGMVIDAFKRESKYFQYIFNNNYFGCGEDVNAPTPEEVGLLVEKVTELHPDVVGLSIRTPARELGRRIVTALRRALPDVRYIGGGYGPTVEAEVFLEYLDYVNVGEGDQSICRLVAEDDPRRFQNVAWMDNGRLQVNPLAKVTRLDDLPFPDWDLDNKYLIEDGALVPLSEAYDTKTYDLFVSKGCPSTCTYCQACQWPRIYRTYGQTMPKIRIRSPQNVIEELSLAKQKYGLQYIRFMDSIFCWNKDWLFELLDLYDTEIGLDFFCNTDVRFIDEERVQRLAASGLKVTQIGIQSVDETVRREVLGRAISDEMIRNYANMLVRNDITIQYDILHWNPFDTRESLERGVSFLRTLPKANEVVVYELKIFPGARINEMYREMRPQYLLQEEYCFWAWIYTMILRSEETDARVNDILDDPEYRRNPDKVMRVCREVLGCRACKEKMFAARDIEKGEAIRSMMLHRKKTDLDGGIVFEDRERLAGRVARRRIEKDTLLRWEDLYTSYQTK